MLPELSLLSLLLFESLFDEGLVTFTVAEPTPILGVPPPASVVSSNLGIEKVHVPTDVALYEKLLTSPTPAPIVKYLSLLPPSTPELFCKIP